MATHELDEAIRHLEIDRRECTASINGGSEYEEMLKAAVASFDAALRILRQHRDGTDALCSRTLRWVAEQLRERATH